MIHSAAVWFGSTDIKLLPLEAILESGSSGSGQYFPGPRGGVTKVALQKTCPMMQGVGVPVRVTMGKTWPTCLADSQGEIAPENATRTPVTRCEDRIAS